MTAPDGAADGEALVLDFEGRPQDHGVASLDAMVVVSIVTLVAAMLWTLWRER